MRKLFLPLMIVVASTGKAAPPVVALAPPMFAGSCYVQFKDEKGNVVKDDDGSTWFAVDAYSFDMVQTLSIGSQSTGAGAGKVTFNPFSISLSASRSLTNLLFRNLASGTPFKQVELALYKATGSGGGGLSDDFIFSFVAAKTQSFSGGDESPKMSVAFEYTGLRIAHYAQGRDGTLSKEPSVSGWDRVKNVSVDAGPGFVQSAPPTTPKAGS